MQACADIWMCMCGTSVIISSLKVSHRFNTLVILKHLLGTYEKYILFFHNNAICFFSMEAQKAQQDYK